MLERLEHVLVSKATYKLKKSVSLFVFDNVLTKNWKNSGSFFIFSVYQFLSSVFGLKPLQPDQEHSELQENHPTI